MKYTRRSFLEAAVAGAAGLRPTVAAAQTVVRANPPGGRAGCAVERRRRGAPRLFPRPRAVPDPALGRSPPATQARHRRDLHAAGCSRPATIGGRGTVEDAGRAARPKSSQPARDGNHRAAWLSNRETHIREPPATLRHGEPVSAGWHRTPSGDSFAARTFRERQGLAELPEAVLATWPAKAMWFLRTTRSARGNASSTRATAPASPRSPTAERASTSTPGVA